jgi:hypothetical protein
LLADYLINFGCAIKKPEHDARAFFIGEEECCLHGLCNGERTTYIAQFKAGGLVIRVSFL